MDAVEVSYRLAHRREDRPVIGVLNETGSDVVRGHRDDGVEMGGGLAGLLAPVTEIERHAGLASLRAMRSRTNAMASARVLSVEYTRPPTRPNGAMTWNTLSPERHTASSAPSSA